MHRLQTLNGPKPWPDCTMLLNDNNAIHVALLGQCSHKVVKAAVYNKVRRENGEGHLKLFLFCAKQSIFQLYANNYLLRRVHALSVFYRQKTRNTLSVLNSELKIPQ